MSIDLRFGWLRGWLLVFVLSRLTGTVIESRQLYRYGRLLAIISRNVSANKAYIALLVLGTGILLSFFIANVVGLDLLARRDSAARRFWIFYSFSKAGGIVVIRAFAVARLAVLRGQAPWHAVTHDSASNLYAAAGAIVWGLYWLRSNRVRRTFLSVPSPDIPLVAEGEEAPAFVADES